MMRKLFGLMALAVFLLVNLAFGKGSSLFQTVDLTDTDSTYVFYFSGSDAWPVPFSSESGWSVWLKGVSTGSATITSVSITEMDQDGDVSDSSGDWTTLTAFSSLSIADSTTIRHEATGSLDYCAGLHVRIVASGGSGTAKLRLYFDNGER